MSGTPALAIMSSDVPGSNSLGDLPVGIQVGHEEALWSATVRVPQDYIYYFHYPWNPRI
jgi:hypothetical protein